jgi:hypothetical protein
MEISANRTNDSFEKSSTRLTIAFREFGNVKIPELGLNVFVVVGLADENNVNNSGLRRLNESEWSTLRANGQIVLLFFSLTLKIHR